jgi:hypothetical protein
MKVIDVVCADVFSVEMQHIVQYIVMDPFDAVITCSAQ